MTDKKSATAVIASAKMDEIILEKYLVNDMPKSNKFCLKKLYRYTGYKYNKLRKYINSQLYSINTKTIDITDDIQLLSVKSKEYVEHLIVKAVFPSNYENDGLIYHIGKFYDSSFFSQEEKKFVELMTAELFSIINFKDFTLQISYKDLLDFNLLNLRPFHFTARKIYNAILQKKLHAGDNIMENIKYDLTNKEIADRLEKSCKFDYFFDKNGNLKCDLDTNRDILIKNYLNTILFEFTDDKSKIILLNKLNGKYPILISE